MDFKKKLSLALAPFAIAMTSIVAFADGTTETDLGATVATELQGVADTALSNLALIVPSALAVVSAILVVKLGVRAFKSVING